VPRIVVIGIRIAIIAAVAIGGLLFRDRLTGGARSHNRHCFDEQTTRGAKSSIIRAWAHSQASATCQIPTQRRRSSLHRIVPRRSTALA
jgi:hypothetical protein